MNTKLLLFPAFLLLSSALLGQKLLTNEMIWENYLFMPNSVSDLNFQNNGKYYSVKEGNNVNQYDITSGKYIKTLFEAKEVSNQSGFDGMINGYEFSTDEQRMLIKSESEAIYRHSTKAKFYDYDFSTKKLSLVFDGGKIRYAKYDPKGKKIAFVFENNLYYKDLSSNAVIQVTTDGEINKIINGATDWVYEEEFQIEVGFQWSPDGSKIAYYRFDETEVPEFTMVNYNGDLYPECQTFKYPKVGQKNAEVRVFIYDVASKTNVEADTYEKDHYIPRIKWTNNSNQLCVFKMNRHQNELSLLLVDADTGNSSELLKEKNKYYIDIHDNLSFLKDGKHFIWTSEKDGWNHIYLYDMEGREKQQLTKGKWEVTKFYGIDEKRDLVYYQAAEISPLERQVYSISLNGKRKQALADEPGWNEAQFSSNFDYYIVNHSTVNTPSSYSVYDNQGRQIRLIEDNAKLYQYQQTFGTSDIEFFDFTTKEDVQLNGWMIKPAHFDPKKKYPVLMYVYGGPGNQQVTDKWKGNNYWWYQLMAQKGFLVVCVDNRGTGGRGEAFKKMTYLQLGKYETIDQIEAAKYIGTWDFVRKDQIGIFGWSYGGYMSSLCLLKGGDVFKAAIAVAPVTNWKWYDTIYTERYMRTTEENPDGYRQNSPIYFAKQMKGKYLLVHGMSDDNVHFQHTAEMAKALIAANKQYDTYFYPNRNHSIYGDKARVHLFNKMTGFLIDNLKNQAVKRSQPTKKAGAIQIREGKKMKSSKY